MELDSLAVLTLLFFGLLAGFLNAIVGGGGLISLPTLLMVGMPPTAAIATNKLAEALGNFTSMMTFLRAGKINTKMLMPIIPFVFVSSVCGALTVSLMSPSVLRPLVIGFYDGFFGPGTGSFIIFVLLLMGFQFLEASASSKLLNFTYGLILGAAMVIGAYVGSKVAMAKGLTFIRLLFIVMTFVLIIKKS